MSIYRLEKPSLLVCNHSCQTGEAIFSPLLHSQKILLNNNGGKGKE